METWVTDIVRSTHYWGIALLMALENLFPPIPSELIMPLAGYVAAQGEINLWLAIIVGAAASVVGTLPWYGVTRWLDKQTVYAWIDRHGHWLTVRRSELERAERWFGRHGWWMVIVGRVIPGIRTLISVPAGFCAMPLPRYLAYSTAGALVWSGLLAHVGKLLGENYEQISTYVDPIAWLVLGSALVIYLVRLVRMRRENKGRRRTSVTV